MVKDNGKTDSLTTYVREYSGIYYSALATVNGDKVTLRAWYGLKRIDHLGYTQSPKGYKPVIYFTNGNGKGWRLLVKVAKQLNGELAYQE